MRRLILLFPLTLLFATSAGLAQSGSIVKDEHDAKVARTENQKVEQNRAPAANATAGDALAAKNRALENSGRTSKVDADYSGKLCISSASTA